MKQCKTCLLSDRVTKFRPQRRTCLRCENAQKALHKKKTKEAPVKVEVPDFDIEVDDTDIITDTTVIPEWIFTEELDVYGEQVYMPDFEPGSGLKRILFIPDCHLPFQDGEAFNLMLRAAMKFRPDIVVVLGDLHDFYAVNAHGKRPDRNGLLKWEVEQSRPFLLQIENINPDAKLIYIEGNHEYRFERYIQNQASSLFGITDVRQILQLDKWTWVPYKKSIKLGKLNITHDTGTAGRNAARTSMDAFQGSVCIGHTHRMGIDFMGNADGPPSVGAHFGWLGDEEHADYMHTIQARRNWVKGFGTGFMDSNGVVYLSAHPIVNGAVVVNGELIT